ncbi:hypothetical protein [Actinomadura parmotrematis]|uniref:Uncharacterized protein n=1 Tax=Actinomadura parmotrematis TaxID=2864039 RepID=A0ABS7FY30_9ACTN|nr:hypothetical protein [Actinomadura parmotrematis]MBW8484584.1 hypothetical protein [Actinomadura parmotrematis]
MAHARPGKLPPSAYLRAAPEASRRWRRLLAGGALAAAVLAVAGLGWAAWPEPARAPLAAPAAQAPALPAPPPSPTRRAPAPPVVSVPVPPVHAVTEERHVRPRRPPTARPKAAPRTAAAQRRHTPARRPKARPKARPKPPAGPSWTRTECARRFPDAARRDACVAALDGYMGR